MSKKEIINRLKENPIEVFVQIKKDFKEVISNLGKVPEKLKPTFNKIGNEISSLVTDETKDKIKEKINNIIECSKEGLDLIGSKDYKGGFDKFKSAGKEVLYCIRNLFTAIKEGMDRGFDAVKHGLGVAYKKLESLGKEIDKKAGR